LETLTRLILLNLADNTDQNHKPCKIDLQVNQHKKYARSLVTQSY
jgi:hypothetical protein